MTELLSCPFCGGEVVPLCVYHPNGYAFGCPNCRMKGPIYKAESAADVPAEAIAAWNQRSPTNAVGAEGERAVKSCPQCEGEGGYPDGLDEAACYTDCTRCDGAGWIVDLAALRQPVEHDALAVGALILKGIGKIDGDGWKDTTKKGQVVFAWNRELEPPYSPDQFPRVGCEEWSASREQYDFTPASAADLPDILASLSRQPVEADGWQSIETAPKDGPGKADHAPK